MHTRTNTKKKRKKSVLLSAGTQQIRRAEKKGSLDQCQGSTRLTECHLSEIQGKHNHANTNTHTHRWKKVHRDRCLNAELVRVKELKKTKIKVAKLASSPEDALLAT